MSVTAHFCLYVCLSVYLSVCLSVCLSVFLALCLPVYLSVILYLSVLSLCLSVAICLSISLCLSVCLCLCHSVTAKQNGSIARKTGQGISTSRTAEQSEAVCTTQPYVEAAGTQYKCQAKREHREEDRPRNQQVQAVPSARHPCVWSLKTANKQNQTLEV